MPDSVPGPSLTVGLVGDHDPSVTAHRAIPLALEMAAVQASMTLAAEWVPTDEIDAPVRVAGYDGLWCVPGSPYRDPDGALRAIRFARETGRPFLGTCGGFQHAVVEVARNVLGWADAEHAETAPDAPCAVVAALACSLVEASSTVHAEGGTRLARAYGTAEIAEEYHCRYGLNPAFREALTAGPLRVAAVDDAGDVRAVEMDGHPFFVATLFQPERAALRGETPPFVTAFVQAVAACAHPLEAFSSP